MPDVPANAKKPADHKKAVEKPDEDGALTVTVSGREWKIPADALDDFELLDDLNALEQREDGTRLPSILTRLLGDEQKRDALNVIRNEDTGRVTIEAGGLFVQELMGGLNPNS